MTENERLTFETELGISIDKNEDCPTMSICWNCDIKVKDCKYFNDVVEKLAKYEAIGTVEELQKAINFKKYFMNLREEGLEVANWHKKGDLEPLDSFIDEACN